MKGATPTRGRGHGQPGQAPHQDRPTWRPPECGNRPTSEIGDPISDLEVRELGFEPVGWRGWRPLTEVLAERLAVATARRRYADPIPFRIPGDAECSVCGEAAEASTVGTPSCSATCTAVLLTRLLETEIDALYTRGDGSGGTSPVRPPAPSKPKLRPISPDVFSVDRALERLGDCIGVLERHGHRIRGRMVFCPFHPNSRTPAMSVYERNGRSRVHCHSCDWSGDAIDLEAALSGEDLATTIRRWS
jgi:CHC2 zinc finger